VGDGTGGGCSECESGKECEEDGIFDHFGCACVQ
jgi:hypothetical protein